MPAAQPVSRVGEPADEVAAEEARRSGYGDEHLGLPRIGVGGTAKSEVAARALALGAELVNDVTALRGDPDLAAVVADHGAYLCLMLDPKWQESGAAELVDRLGVQAAPLLQRCVDTATTPGLRRLAEHALARARDHHRRR